MLLETLLASVLVATPEGDGVRMVGCGFAYETLDDQLLTGFTVYRIEVRQNRIDQWERWDEDERRFVNAATGYGGCTDASPDGLPAVTCLVTPGQYALMGRSGSAETRITVDRRTGAFMASASRDADSTVHINRGACGPTVDPSRRRQEDPHV